MFKFSSSKSCQYLALFSSANPDENVCGQGAKPIPDLHCDPNSETVKCPGMASCQEIRRGDETVGVCCRDTSTSDVTAKGTAEMAEYFCQGVENG